MELELNEMTPALEADITQIDTLWQQGIKTFQGPFLAGNKFTAVDAFFAPVVFRIQTYNLEVSVVSKQYVNLMLEQPFMKEWYQAALEEKWRDLPHDEDTMNAGKIILDQRSI